MTGWGGEPPFAAICTKISYAQIASFAKLRGTAAHRDVIGPKPTLVQFASNGSTQPRADVLQNYKLGKSGHRRKASGKAEMRDEAVIRKLMTKVRFHWKNANHMAHSRRLH